MPCVRIKALLTEIMWIRDIRLMHDGKYSCNIVMRSTTDSVSNMSECRM